MTLMFSITPLLLQPLSHLKSKWRGYRYLTFLLILLAGLLWLLAYESSINQQMFVKQLRYALVKFSESVVLIQYVDKNFWCLLW
ncbi:hypothetical protein CsSME_00018471 [Camellia sinensis var. sinensis]